jgi:predicted ArsR family transcriptional regulator
LEQLSEAGFVTRTTQGRSHPGRPKVLYAPVPESDRSQLPGPGSAAPGAHGASAQAYRELAAALAAQLSDTEDAHARAVLAGRRWAGTAGLPPGAPAAVAPAVAAPASRKRPGQTSPARAGAQGAMRPDEALRRMTSLMDELGFGPVADDNRILLRKCPFAELAREHRTVICGMHKGMLDQALDNMGAPLAVQRVDALLQSDPLLCVVHLRPTEAAGVY